MGCTTDGAKPRVRRGCVWRVGDAPLRLSAAGEGGRAEEVREKDRVEHRSRRPGDGGRGEVDDWWPMAREGSILVPLPLLGKDLYRPDSRIASHTNPQEVPRFTEGEGVVLEVCYPFLFLLSTLTSIRFADTAVEWVGALPLNGCTHAALVCDTHKKREEGRTKEVPRHHFPQSRQGQSQLSTWTARRTASRRSARSNHAGRTTAADPQRPRQSLQTWRAA